MKFYENKNNRHKFSKNFFQNKPYTPVVKKQGHPIFSPGDLVGFRNFFRDDEGIVLYHRHNEKNGKVEYVVKIKDRWSNVGSEHVFVKSEMYLKPLTRKVLFEKHPYTRHKCGELISLEQFSGTTYIHQYVISNKGRL